jgi:hypothetical protein
MNPQVRAYVTGKLDRAKTVLFPVLMIYSEKFMNIGEI